MKDETSIQASISKGWKYFIVVGVIAAVAGLAATNLPEISGLTISTIIGIIFLITGSVQIYHTFSIHSWKEKLWYVISAVLYIIGGLFLIIKPFEGLLTLTTILVAIIIFNGISRMIFGISNRTIPGCGYIIFSGLLSTVMGGYFLFLLDNPEISLSLLGIFVGVSLLIEGISFIFLGFQMKKLVDEKK